jgi:hypothetical protein
MRLVRRQRTPDYNGQYSMRPPRAFISSTYRDLRFERRFVRHILQRTGFDVVSMEEHYRPDFEWQRWSQNRAAQCDVLVQLLADRVGSRADRGLFPDAAPSITKLERDHARCYGVEMIISYELHRPFPDAVRLYSPEEANEYEQTLQEKDTRVSQLAILERSFRLAIPISSAEELETRLVHDTHLSFWILLRHRWRLWYRAYWDTTFAASLRVFEDESYIGSSSRVALWRHLHKWVWITSLLLLVLLRFVPLVWMGLGLIAGLATLGVSVLAWAPSYYSIGTKTIMARGMFGLRTIQQSTAEPFGIVRRWHILKKLTPYPHLGAVTIYFASGKRIFVPLVNNPI